MKGSGPAAATAGVLAMAWVVWELWRVVWLAQVGFGVNGGPVLDWTGLGLPTGENGGLGTLVVLPVLAGLFGVVASLIFARVQPRGGLAIGALGGIALAGWAAFAGLFSLGTVVDPWLQAPVFAVKTDFVFHWAPWSRWIFDGAVLLAVCSLLGFGPDTAAARRATWTALLMVIADNGWRAAVMLFSGSLPLLSSGLQLGWGDLIVSFLLGGLALGFVALFGNLPAARGPNRLTVYSALGVAGLWQGLSAALLWIAPLLERAGLHPVVDVGMPEYDGMLAVLRVLLYVVGAACVGIGVWRSSR